MGLPPRRTLSSGRERTPPRFPVPQPTPAGNCSSWGAGPAGRVRLSASASGGALRLFWAPNPASEGPLDLSLAKGSQSCPAGILVPAWEEGRSYPGRTRSGVILIPCLPACLNSNRRPGAGLSTPAGSPWPSGRPAVLRCICRGMRDSPLGGQTEARIERLEKMARMRLWPGRSRPSLMGEAGLGEGPEPFQFLKVCNQYCIKMMNRPSQDWLAH